MPAVVRRARVVTEATIQAEIRTALAAMPDVTIFRNNVGLLRDARGVPVRFGLAKGSADLIGSLRVPVSTGAGMPVHRWIARAIAIEVKHPGKHPTKEQLAWLSAMKTRGWITGVAHSVEEAVSIVESARRWEI